MYNLTACHTTGVWVTQLPLTDGPNSLLLINTVHVAFGVWLCKHLFTLHGWKCSYTHLYLPTLDTSGGTQLHMLDAAIPIGFGPGEGADVQEAPPDRTRIHCRNHSVLVAAPVACLQTTLLLWSRAQSSKLLLLLGVVLSGLTERSIQPLAADREKHTGHRKASMWVHEASETDTAANPGASTGSKLNVWWVRDSVATSCQSSGLKIYLPGQCSRLLKSNHRTLPQAAEARVWPRTV